MLSHMYPSAVRPHLGVFVHEQVQALRRRGHDVRVVNPLGWAPPLLARWAAHRQVPGTEVLQGVPVLHPRMLSLPGARLGPRNCEAMHLGVARAVRRVHERWPFDVIHAHMVVPDGWVAARLGAALGVPVVATAHRADGWMCGAQRCRPGRVAQAVGLITRSGGQRVVGDAAARSHPRGPSCGAQRRRHRDHVRAPGQMRAEFQPAARVHRHYGGSFCRAGGGHLSTLLCPPASRPAVRRGSPPRHRLSSAELEARAIERGVAEHIRLVGRVVLDRVGVSCAGDLVRAAVPSRGPAHRRLVRR